MPFQFTLDSLLRLRRSQQRQQEILVQKENERVNQLTRELEAIGGEFAQICSAGRAFAKMHGAEFHFDDSRTGILRQRFSHTERLLHEAQERQALLASELHTLWQQREVLETLRQEERDAFTVEESRRDQRRQDDLFLLQKRKG